MATISRDIRERKRSERNLHAAQAELAHIARVTTTGELAASIAHEVNQPLTAVVSNANACLRWLGAAEPNLDEAAAAVTRIAREGTRAAEIIGRIRALLRKRPPQVTTFDMNHLVAEVLTLTNYEIRRNRLTLEHALCDTTDSTRLAGVSSASEVFASNTLVWSRLTWTRRFEAAGGLHGSIHGKAETQRCHHTAVMDPRSCQRPMNIGDGSLAAPSRASDLDGRIHENPMKPMLTKILSDDLPVVGLVGEVKSRPVATSIGIVFAFAALSRNL